MSSEKRTDENTINYLLHNWQISYNKHIDYVRSLPSPEMFHGWGRIRRQRGQRSRISTNNRNAYLNTFN